MGLQQPDFHIDFYWPVTALGPYREIPPGNSHVVTGFQMLVALSDGLAVETFNAIMPGWSASERKILFRALAGHHLISLLPGGPRRQGAGRAAASTTASAAIKTRRNALNERSDLCDFHNDLYFPPTIANACSKARLQFRKASFNNTVSLAR
jgi:hypothetical protein